MANSRLIVVLGMHRSGTSVVTRALQVMNVSLGDKLMPAAARGNPKGFFEDSDIHTLNVEMLHALGIDWFSLTPVEDHGVETLRKNGFFLRAVELLKSKCAVAPTYAFKDPRTAKLLLFWKAVFDHCRFDVSYVVAIRHPRSVAESLSKRNDFDLEKGYLLWLEHVIKIIEFTQTSRCVYVDYDKLILAPDTQLRRIAAALRLKVNAAELKSFKSGFLDRSLRHTMFTLDDLQVDPACPPLARDIYGELVGLADANFTKKGRLNEPQLDQWITEFSRLRSTLLYMDRLALEKSNTDLKLFVPSKVFQVFFDTGAGFSELDSVRIDTPGAAVPTEFVVDLPGSSTVLDLRVDPLDDFAVLRGCEIFLVKDNDEVVDLMPFSRPDAVVSADGAYFFHTKDPAIYFDLPPETLDAAKCLKITLSYQATGHDAERQCADHVHTTRERELQQRLVASHEQMQRLDQEWSERAGATERQLAQEKALLVTQYMQVQKDLGDGHIARERELEERLLESQDQMRLLECGLSEKAGATERQLAQEKALLVSQHAQVEKELRETHTTRERELQERLVASHEQMQQFERGLSEKAGATERQLAQEKALLVSQHVQVEKELREAHATRERELQERLVALLEQMQQFERGLSEKAGATERQLAQEKILLSSQHVQAEKNLREAHATREREWGNKALAQERELAQQKALLEKDLQGLQEKLLAAEREKALVAVQHAHMESNRTQTHLMHEREFQERLREAQEQMKKQERELTEKNDAQERRQTHERALLSQQLLAVQEKLQIGEQEKAVFTAQQIEAQRELSQLHATREQAMHQQLQATQEEMQKLLQKNTREAEAQESLLSQEKARLSIQIQDLQEELKRGAIQQQLVLDKYVQSENNLANSKAAQEQATEAHQQVTQKYNQTLLETNQKLERIRTAWFWRPFAGFSPATRSFRHGSMTTSVASLQPALEHANKSGKPYQSLPAAGFDLNKLISHDGNEFIKHVYMALLGRNPDPEGFEYYSQRLSKLASKQEIIYQIHSSPEAQRLGRRFKGLDALVRREKFKRAIKVQLPIHAINRFFERGRVDALSQEKSAVFGVTKVKTTDSEILRVDGIESKVTAAAQTPDLSGENISLPAIAVEILRTTPKDGLRNISSYFMQAVENKALQGDGYTFTRLMLYVWNSRLDLQNTFDIHHSQGRIDYAIWFLLTASKEYGLTPKVYPLNMLEKLLSFGGVVREEAASMMALQHSDSSQTSNSTDVFTDVSPVQNAVGANLIGYAFGEFGMGEHVRMVARALSNTDMPFCVLDQGVGVHGAGDLTVSDWVVSSPSFGINVFHVNADVFPPLYFKFGEAMFTDRYNIGYWAWELSKCPPEFDVALNMVDEVWAISDFVAESFKTRSTTAVVTMPLAVTVPALDASYTKKYYNLPEDGFIFLYTFDAASYLDRKNPIAAIRAFKLAFPVGARAVHLVLKTMNIEVAGPMWGDLAAEAALDPRIIIVTKRMSRTDVLGMNLACDAFVSLHRSEGFGRCVAEAMAYGKPVIVTNYSGTRDFANERTAFLVDYQLVPVPKGMYPFGGGQVWAEPDIKHAAELMTLVAADALHRNRIANSGQRFILDNFNERVVGARYAKRLKEIAASRLANQMNQPVGGIAEAVNEFEGCLDGPEFNAKLELTDAVSIEGWAISRNGISTVDIHLNERPVGRAHYGLIRNDVQKAYPKIPNSARSGFCFLLDTSNLTEGAYALSVVLTSHSGEVKTWASKVSLLPSTRYAKWLNKAECLQGQKPAYVRNKSASLTSVIVRASSTTDLNQLDETLKSLKTQGPANFEVILMAPLTARDRACRIFKRSTLRCRFAVVDESAENLKSLLMKCHGNVVAIIDVGEQLQPNSLMAIDEVFHKDHEVGLIYGDEDHTVNDIRSRPIFKPGWSPVLLESYNYIGNAWFARTSLARAAIERALNSFETSNEHALLNEIGDLASKVVHIPAVLLSRTEQQSQNRLVHKGMDNLNRNQDEPALPKVSIIIPTCLNDIAMVESCFHGLMRATDYPHIEVIVIFNNTSDQALVDSCAKKWPFRFLQWNKPFSWAAINNFGASNASGEYLLFMNDDVEPIEKDWLRILVLTLLRTGAGAVGPLLSYPNGTVQHAGMYISRLTQGMRHLFRFSPVGKKHDHWLVEYPREVSAVTGACLLTTKKCFDEVGLFDENLPLVCNDVDYCFRLAEKGYPVVIEPHAKLIHHEGVSRAGMSEDEDVAKFRVKWRSVLQECDIYSNPNLDAGRDDWSVNPDIDQKFGPRFSKSRLQGVLT